MPTATVEKNWGHGTQEIGLDVPSSPTAIVINVKNPGETEYLGTGPSNPPQPPTPANYLQRQFEPARYHDMTVETVTVSPIGSAFQVTVSIANGADAPTPRTVKLSVSY